MLKTSGSHLMVISFNRMLTHARHEVLVYYTGFGGTIPKEISWFVLNSQLPKDWTIGWCGVKKMFEGTVTSLYIALQGASLFSVMRDLSFWSDSQPSPGTMTHSKDLNARDVVADALEGLLWLRQCLTRSFMHTYSQVALAPQHNKVSCVNVI